MLGSRMNDVLIIGAGPTGLSCAAELLRYQIPFRIIDQNEGPSIHSKALAIQPRTLEMLEKLGVVDTFLGKGLKQKEIFYHYKNQKFKLQLEGLDTHFPYILILPQSETENILIRHLEEKGIKIEWKTRLIDLKEGKATVELPSGQIQEIESKWFVACDGAHSTTRKLLNLPFEGTQFSEEFLIADALFDSPQEIKKDVHLYLSQKGMAILFPLPQKNSFRLILPEPKKEMPDAAELTSALEERGYNFPYKISEILWLSKFYIHRRICSVFRYKNIFLAGDAAHIHSPAGGQGMNTSIQDVLNLGWKLSYVIKGISSPNLLTTYEIERIPVAKKVLKATSFATRLVTFGQKFCPALLFWLIKAVFSNKKRRARMSQNLSQLAVNYRKSFNVKRNAPDSKWAGPKPGDRAPDAILENGTCLFELLKTPYHHLLLFERNPTIEKEIQKYEKWISVHVIEDKEVKKKYEAGPKSVFLIRPDGYIGYQSRSFIKENFFEYLSHAFLVT